MAFEDVLAGLPSLGQPKVRLPRRGPSRAGVRWSTTGISGDRSDRCPRKRCKELLRTLIGSEKASTQTNASLCKRRYSILIIALLLQGSLDALNEVLKEPVRMNRFRANLLVDGCHPYSEDLWKTVKINKLTFMGVRMRDCCKVPTVDQENGTPGIEPNETLRTFRSGEVLRPSHSKKGRQVYFGQNLVCKESLSANGKGRIVRVGDPVYVLQSYSSTNEAPA